MITVIVIAMITVIVIAIAMMIAADIIVIMTMTTAVTTITTLRCYWRYLGDKTQTYFYRNFGAKRI